MTALLPVSVKPRPPLESPPRCLSGPTRPPTCPSSWPARRRSHRPTSRLDHHVVVAGPGRGGAQEDGCKQSKEIGFHDRFSGVYRSARRFTTARTARRQPGYTESCCQTGPCRSAPCHTTQGIPARVPLVALHPQRGDKQQSGGGESLMEPAPNKVRVPEQPQALLTGSESRP